MWYFFCKFIKKKKKLKYDVYISIQTLNSVLRWSTFGSDYNLESSWVWCYKLAAPVFGEFLPFCSADPLKICRVGWVVLLHSYFQVSPEMFRSGSSPASGWATQGHSEACTEATPALPWCLGLLSCWKVNLRPSLRSWALWIKDLCTLLTSSFLCSALPQSWLVSQSLPLKNIPTAWCCHHHASPYGWCQVSSRHDA